MTEEKHSPAELMIEIEQLKETVECLVKELENEGLKCNKAKEKLPENLVTEPEPPWVRDGYNDKRTWLQEKGE